MPKVRDVLVHVSVEMAKAKRKCHRKPEQHSMQKGEVCLVIKDSATGGSKNYCPECAEPILNAAKTRIAELENALASGLESPS